MAKQPMPKTNSGGSSGGSNGGRLYSYLLCALFAAVTAILSQIMIPLPFTPVPINLALLAVWVCGGMLGPKKAAISMIVYILLGAIGVPVFVGFTGGLGALAGPTGGYIIGYLPSAVLMGVFLSERAGYSGAGRIAVQQGVKRVLFRTVKGIPAMLVCYAFGTVWFIILTGMQLIPALLLCIVPFIPGDVLKMIAAVLILDALRKRLKVSV
jgi:biotin transport system substrate-specific component